jgi:hypothetical protein
MIFYVVVFSFLQSFRSFYTNIYYIHLQIFPTRFFFKIIFILYDVQILKEECYNINIKVITCHRHEPATTALVGHLVPRVLLKGRHTYIK